MISVELWRARIGTFNNKHCSGCSLSSSSLVFSHCRRQTHHGSGSTESSQEEPSSEALTSPSSSTLATREQSQTFSSTDHHSTSSWTSAPQSRSQLTSSCLYGSSFSSTFKSSSSSSPSPCDLHRSLLRDAVITLLIAIISQLLMIAGDIETNPGPKHRADDKPGLDELLCMSYTDEDGSDTHFRLMDRLQPYWKRLAVALKFHLSDITIMKQEDDPVFHLLSEWLRGANQERDSRPVTWATFITALREANVQEEVDILEEHFVEKRLPVIPVAMSQAEESQEPGKYFELIHHPSGGYIMRNGPIQVLIKPNVPEKLRSLLKEYASMLMILRRSKLSEGNFSDLKLYLSGYCSLESIEQCTSLRAVVDLLIKHLRVYMFNIYILNISCKYFNDTTKDTVQKYRKCLNKFFRNTSVKKFKSTIETQVVDKIGMESVTLKLDENRVDDTLTALNTLLYHFFGNCSKALSLCEIGSGCVCITWLVSASLVSTLRARIEQHTQESLASRGVLELVIGLRIAPVNIEVRMENEVTKLNAKLEACQRMIRARDIEMSNRSSSAVQNEKLKIDLKAAQQEKSCYKEKCKELEIERQKIEVQMKNDSEKIEREMKVVQELQTKIAAYQKEVEAREQQISQLKKELNALESEMRAFRDQNNGLDTVIKKLRRNLSYCEMECERLKKALNVAQQQKDIFEEKAQKLGNKVEMFEKKVSAGNVLTKTEQTDKLIFSGLSFPRGIAVTRENHLVVVEWGKQCVSIIDTSSGRIIGTLGANQFVTPSGVVVTRDGHFVVADFSNHHLQVWTAEYTLSSVIGSKGSQPLQFDYPWDIATHPNGQLFITDSENHRIQVLNHNFTYSHSFGSKGSNPGQFNEPRGIAINTVGQVFVADYGNNRVQKFTSEGIVLNVIYVKGRFGQLDRPQGLCIDDKDTLYVTEWYSLCNRVCVFTGTGEFLEYLGDSNSPSSKYPRFIVTDIKSRLFISQRDRLVAYMIGLQKTKSLGVKHSM